MKETPPTEKTPDHSTSVAAATNPAPPPRSNPREFTVKWIGILAIAIVFGLALYFLLPGFYEEETDDAYVEAHIVSVMPKLPAYASNPKIDDNIRVKAGELLLELDSRDYLVESNNASAGLKVAESKLNEALSAVTVATAIRQCAFLLSKTMIPSENVRNRAVQPVANLFQRLQRHILVSNSETLQGRIDDAELA